MRIARDQPTLLLAAALGFLASAAATVTECASMAAMPGMEMPGGWTMSMAWMRMPGQSWIGAAASFLGMWAVMMVAMMLPALVPMLARYRAALPRVSAQRRRGLTLRVAGGYFGAWLALGVAVFPLGTGIAVLAMASPALSRLAPAAAGLALVFAGAWQLSAWKRRQLACCREPSGCCSVSTRTRAAWRHGLRIGLQCLRCCAPMTLALLVTGVMDLAVMATTTAAICLERLLPHGERAARISGIAMSLGGLLCLTTA